VDRALDAHWRILAVNILTVLILALGIIYLDAFRTKLSKERLERIEREAAISAIAARSNPARSSRRLRRSANPR
jgi:two-component system, OmpR family, sensor histidine kinase ChvG